jgi:hypothetical protein
MFHSAAIRECTVRNYPARLIYPETAEAQHHALYDPKQHISTKTSKRKGKTLFFSTRSRPCNLRRVTSIYHHSHTDTRHTIRRRTHVNKPPSPCLRFLYYLPQESSPHGTGGFYPSFLASTCSSTIVYFLSGLGSGNFTHARLATCNLILMRC